MALSFEWDETKAAANEERHGVSFEEATSAFADPLSLTNPDRAHSDVEDRFILLGESFEGELLVVVYTERGETIRLISCRLATWAEQKYYEQEQ